MLDNSVFLWYCSIGNNIKGVNKMLKVVNDIITAQKHFKKKYGEEGYKKLIKRMDERSEHNLLILKEIYRDEKMTIEVRLLALACMGENTKIEKISDSEIILRNDSLI